MQIACGEHLRQHYYLAGVHREVFGDVEDGFQDVDVVALDCEAGQERARVDGAESLFDFGKSRPEQVQQLIARNQISSLELSVAITCAWPRSDTRHNPLTRIPAEVQDQITDAV